MMKLYRLASLVFISFSFLIVRGQSDQRQLISLAGEWELCLDSAAQERNTLRFNLNANLPGTLDGAGIGKPLAMAPELKREVMLHLQRKHTYIGKAWYRKTVTIPADAAGKKAVLKLERVLWESTVFLDGKKLGSENSLSVPHRYDLTGLLTAGEHELLICVDNSKQFELNKDNMAHAYTNETQIMWNGILGDLQIELQPVAGFTDLQVYPDLRQQRVRVKAEGSFDAQSKIILSVRTLPGNKLIGRKVFDISQEGEYELDLKRAPEAWNEFSPVLYQLEATLTEGGKKVSAVTETFGFRKLATNGSRLLLNGNPVFLRGTLECGVFPLTGHPPVEKQEWLKIFKTARSFGLNHLRFHSWCPPEAAFIAADQAGFYLQVELPNWNTAFGQDEASARFVESEARRIVQEYGNHPSFCLMAMGNELQGDFPRLHRLVNELKGMDDRHLYTTTSFTFEEGHGKMPEPVDDFLITQYTDSGWVRGQGVFDTDYPDFNTDYTKAVGHLPVPLITHEIGQYSVFPDLKEIDRYTGVLDPLNFKAVRRDLEEKGLLHLANDYLMASGKLAALLYKEEIERALKTDGISGFQLLDLHDFPGQGTALVGLLNAFWESKGIIEPDEFRQFCAEVVPLIWMEKAVYLNSERIVAEVGVANHFKTLEREHLRLELRDGEGRMLHKKRIRFGEIPAGRTTKSETFSIPLDQVREARQFMLTLALEGSPWKNTWPVWVYPAVHRPQQVAPVVVTRSFDEAERALGEGKKVLLNPDPRELKGVEGKFVPVFWSPVHFPDQPGTMGLLIEPAHPVFKQFPTSFHSNWQWWALCKGSKTLETGGLPVTPLVRVVDNFFKNRSLTNLFEVKAGNGRLLFSSVDLFQDSPEAKQLMHSVLEYMKSHDFNPQTTIEFELLKRFGRKESLSDQ